MAAPGAEKCMNRYLTDTDYAVKSLFAAITYERDELNNLRKELDAARNKHNAYHLIVLGADGTPFAQHYKNELQSAGREKNEKEMAVQDLQSRIDDREFSEAILSGAVLQIAKQGISVVWKGRENCPKAREVFGQPIGDVIWAGRNQAVHFDESVRQETAKVLIALAEHGADARLKDAKGKINLAPVVLDVLGWQDYGSYLKDMTAILS
jgi:hypothetical protein